VERAVGIRPSTSVLRRGSNGPVGQVAVDTRVSELRPAGSDDGRNRRHAIVLANRLPWPLDDGWKVRTFHVVRGIARHARVTLVVFNGSADGDEAAAAFGPEVRLITVEPPRPYTAGALVRGLVTRYPVHIWNQESSALRGTLAALVSADPPDVFVAESTFVARYMDGIPAGVPRVIDTHNVDSVTFGRYATAMRPGPRRVYATITARKLASFERATYRRANAVWVCSDVEREIVRGMAPSTPVWTVPNGVDTRHFSPAGSASDPDRVLFFGRLDYYPNVDGLGYFIREILPELKRRRPGIRFDVVGAGAAREVEALASMDPAVRLVGRVPDLRTVLRGAAVVVVPLRVGGGTRLKVLEAMSMARPVVSTAIGAEGIAARSGEDLVIADDARAFGAAVADLLDDPAKAAAIGESGRSLVSRHYDWSHIGGILGGSLGELAGPGGE